MSEIVHNLFLNLYIIKKLGRSLNKCTKTIMIMREIFETIIYFKFCYIILINIGFRDFIINN